MSASKFETMALEYRARAEDSSALARASGLDRTREQHEQAALRWIELAEAAESRAESQRVRLAAAPKTPEDAAPEDPVTDTPARDLD
ncbi:hypothetical protein LJR219_003199 [Phenylobacterium sp. LjRoot219]|uniref:hypothetical protein n=1 Tax=Phenylobacterium sp. LjRoot219 TaxID=3342283 RepID=UPI003ECF44FA